MEERPVRLQGRRLALWSFIVLLTPLGAFGASVSINDVQVTEGATASFSVTVSPRPNSSAQGVTIGVGTQNPQLGTARAGTDYTAKSSSIRFTSSNCSRASANCTKTFTVATINDTVAESTESFNVILTAPSGTNVTKRIGVGTILDNDQPTNRPPICAITAPPVGASTFVGRPLKFAASASDPDAGDTVTVSWQFDAGSSVSPPADSPVVRYSTAGTHTVTLTAKDSRGAVCTQTLSVLVNELPKVSINSTSTNGSATSPNGQPVTERPRLPNWNEATRSFSSNAYGVLAVNDLGMHCGDLDTRVASILPPFQVLLGQVIRRGATPVINPPGTGLKYSAASNPNDPILNNPNFDGVAQDGSVYKTNFWDGLAHGAYDPFYPASVTPLVSVFPLTGDNGLPVPNVERLYLGDGQLAVQQQAMPGIGSPYQANTPQVAREHYQDKPFFINFPFGYVAKGVNWFEGGGVPLAAFDDFGRENPYPLFRVEATNNGATVATSDAVLPISGETTCFNCHASEQEPSVALRTDKPWRALAAAGLARVLAASDPKAQSVPEKVSLEWATDQNILRLHDIKHGSRYVNAANVLDATTKCTITGAAPNGNPNCLINKAVVQQQPVVCQTCHYTPALDLAHAGPQNENGRTQTMHESNSRVMHNHHGKFTDLFPLMPKAIQAADGSISNQGDRAKALEESCYQCHPGKETKCLRGAMFNGGILCSDCHGDMQQVGKDFSEGVSHEKPGAFKLGLGNYYQPGSSQPRVPWANEPGCGSCHIGDAVSHPVDGAAVTTASKNVLVNIKDSHGVTDGIRLRQAFRMDTASGVNDPKATPIVPTNKRFAEPAIEGTVSTANPAGVPQLFRVSTGHGGVTCEGCHGATHAEWPVKDPNANDNVIAREFQGHTGPISECAACHTAGVVPSNTQAGPHGMHVVNDSRFWKEAHKDMAKRENKKPGGGTCGACHGSDHLGTVLSRVPVDRSFTVESRVRKVPAGQSVACNLCHSVDKSFGR